MTAPRRPYCALRPPEAALGALWAGALCLAWACASGHERHHAPAPMPDHVPAGARGPTAGAPDAGHDADPPAPGGAGPALTEAAARALLAERFRAAGLRVRYDVPVTRDGAFALTVDGYDPARRIGFEYVAAAEAGADLDPAEREALARDREERILIIDATGAARAEDLAERFLQALGLSGPPVRE